MSKMYIYPANNNENQYINIQEKAIKSAGLDVTYSLKDFLSTEYFLLNWFETLGGNIFLDYIKKCIKLALMKIFRKKILWVVHNKKPHSKTGKDKSNNFSILLMKKLLLQAYRIIILCDETKNVLNHYTKKSELFLKKIYKIPHPNYIGIYPETNKITGSDKKTLKILYIGQVNQYKNIEYLIEAVNSINNENIKLTIAGNCKDSTYKEKLIKSAENNNTIYDLRFIPDQELIRLIFENDIIALPYSYESSLNSGTIFLAFSYKKTVISPLIGTLKEFPDKTLFYSYDYKNEAEHKNILRETIQKVYKEYFADSTVLKNKGEAVYNYVKEHNNLDVITKLYKKLTEIE